MKYSLLLNLFFISTNANAVDQNCSDLKNLWHSDDIYFQPDKSSAKQLDGIYFSYSEKTCRKSQEENSKCKTEKIDCPPYFLAKAEFPYTKLTSFPAFFTRFQSCVKANDKNCLRSLISRSVKTSFGQSSYEDHRTALIDKLLSSDKTFATKSISAINYRGQDYLVEFGSADHGKRGGFKFKNGFWLLDYYVAGD